MLYRMVAAAALVAASAGAARAGDGACLGECYVRGSVPPRYEVTAEPVLEQAPRTYALLAPATYATIYETVVVRPAGRRWSVTHDAYGRAVGCWIDEPARTAVVPRRVMTRPASLVPYAQTSVYGVRTASVLVEPGRRGWVPVGRH